jgi:multisubunit Na+/H+ antiporter MnhG subunit
LVSAFQFLSSAPRCALANASIALLSIISAYFLCAYTVCYTAPYESSLAMILRMLIVMIFMFVTNPLEQLLISFSFIV